MEHILTEWRHIAPEFGGKDLLLFLDFDGTLTPLVDDPDEVQMTVPYQKILKKIATSSGIQTAVVSGRSLEDLKKRVMIPELILIGNHGIEVEGPSLRHTHPDALTLRKFFTGLTTQLQKALEGIRGIHVENKVFALSVHYRHAASREIPHAMEALFKVISPSVRRSEVVYVEGKKVWEVRPAIPWDKGKIVLWLLARECARNGRDVLPIYIGDDLTDEDALKVLKKKGVGIKVTGDEKEDSHADYWLHSPAEVFEFLKKICALKQPKPERPKRSSL